MDKPKVSFSIASLSWMSDDALNEIIRSNVYDEETKKLAARVINARMYI
ncbi:hypothetical protein NVP1198B_05 [Vibrio phage 1.198.B._10N.286.54.F4]|nr:hypothetical protein NVP1198A_05 [Vibrio phage 1.198.A._10N.286.54.F4]AUR94793.1 hypothetical protein NVP1198B_05 [Vibrio phage 1.198.B._10N.286.54.F4]